MRTNIFILTFLFSTTLIFAQTDEKVNAIRKIVEQINKDTTYTTKTLDNLQWMEQMADGGGQLTGYFKNGLLVKIVERVGFSSCVTTFEYYMQNNSLLFVYGQEKVFKYDDSISTFNSNIQTIGMECRFYFDNNKLVQSKLTGQTRCSQQPSDADATNLLADCKKYIEQLKK